MEDKYYTPKVEELYIGYICEFNNVTESSIWNERIITQNNLYQAIFNCKDKRVRTPYLTKEQILENGWEILELKGFAYRYGKPSYRDGFQKDNYFLILDTRKHHIEIIAKDVTKIDFLPEFPENFGVTIPCSSINEFKKICNWLNIK